jgi:hypothetical protein
MNQGIKNQFTSTEIPLQNPAKRIIKVAIKICAWLMFLHIISLLVRGDDFILAYGGFYDRLFYFLVTGIIWSYSRDLYERICARPLMRNETIRIVLDIILLVGSTIFSLWLFLGVYIF